jgi:hypothetical protein
MNTTKKTPPIVQLGAWLLSLIVFAIGFWHTHLGLKEMNVFGSEWGGLAVAAIVLLLILITYWYAVNGRKMALIFYVLGGIIFFVCNLNYFYPSYLSRKLVREEATLLNDTLQVYTNKGKRLLSTVGFKDSDGSLKDYRDMETLKNSVIEEIRKNGQGPRSRKYFADFNKICEKHKIPVIILSDDAKMTDVEFANYYLGLFTGRMRQFLENKTEAGGDLGDAQNFVLATEMYVAIQKKYTPILIDSIIPDNSEIKIENIKSNPQVITLQKLASELDEASSQINESLKNKKGDKTLPNFSLIGETKSQNIGTIAHTVASIKDRITKVDTWAIIILCLFVDLIVPLAIYLLLRKEGDKEEESGLRGKRRPIEL